MGTRLTLLGTGTSHGVPMIGCDCSTCRSTDPRDNRTNSSLLVTANGQQILIDCGRDFRIQALRHGLRSLDALLITHAHYDHIAGIDDLRVFTTRGRGSLPVYGRMAHLNYLREHSFRYLFDGNGHKGGGVASLTLQPIASPWEICTVQFRPIPALHGTSDVYGYRFCDCAYLPDVSKLPDAALEALTGLRLLIIDGLRYRPHVSHLSVDQAVAISRKLAPAATLLTHICHDIRHADLADRLRRETGGTVGLAYDGLTIDLEA